MQKADKNRMLNIYLARAERAMTELPRSENQSRGEEIVGHSFKIPPTSTHYTFIPALGSQAKKKKITPKRADAAGSRPAPLSGDAQQNRAVLPQPTPPRGRRHLAAAITEVGTGS